MLMLVVASGFCSSVIAPLVEKCWRFYLRGSQFTLRKDHSSLRWLQKSKNEDGMLARWYLLLGQFSVMFEYRPGSQHANADGMSRQCGQCRRPDCPVSVTDLPAADADTQLLLVDQPFASSEMGDLMDSDLLPELSGETWVASALLEELTVDLPTAGSDIELVAASREDNALQTVWSWVESGSASTVVGYVRIVLWLLNFTLERIPWTRRGLLRRFVHINRT